MGKPKEINYVGGTSVRRCTTRETFEAVGQFSEPYHRRLGGLKYLI